jgi:hypothetical protein
MIAAYVRLLAAHDRASAAGEPLLSRDGVAFVQELLGVIRATPIIPRWDNERGVLWLGDRVLKKFRQPAPSQSAILDAFEEGGWASRHPANFFTREDGETAEQARQKLYETIRNLNRGLPPCSIRFRHNRAGTGIFWELCASSADSDR